ncbi:MAG: tetratricopeptide repeat protein [Paludibacteraceae bacterium]
MNFWQKTVVSVIFVVAGGVAAATTSDLDTLYHAYATARGADRRQQAAVLVRQLVSEEWLDSTFDANKQPTDYVHACIAAALGTRAYYANDFAKAIDYAAEAVDYTPADSLDLLADAYTTLGSAYQRLGQYETALSYRLKCLAIDEEMGDSANISSSLSNLASIYLTTGQTATAETYLQRAIAIERRQPETRALAVRLGMLGEVYLQEQRLDEALQATAEAVALDSAAQRQRNLGIRLSQLGAVQLAQGHYAQARHSLNQALQLLHATGNRTSEAITYQQLGRIATRTGRTSEADQYFKKSIEIGETIGNRLVLQKSYQELYQLHKPTNPALALDYFEQSQALQDTMFAEKLQSQLSDFRVKYDTQEKEHRIAMHEATIKRQRAWTAGIVGIALLCFALAVLAYYYSRLTKRHNRELTEANALKNKFFSIISHDLKNPVLAQRRALENLSKSLHQLSPAETATVVDMLYASVTAQADLLQNLLVWAQLQTGRIAFTPVICSVNEAAKAIAALTQLQVRNKQLQFDIDMPTTCTCLADKNMLTTVLRNLVSNAIKFTETGGRILLKAYNTADACHIEVSDTGIGMDADTQKRLFRLDTRHTAIGTDGEQGTGLGLIICRDMILRNGGSIDVQSVPAQGTTFVITLKSH